MWRRVHAAVPFSSLSSKGSHASRLCTFLHASNVRGNCTVSSSTSSSSGFPTQSVTRNNRGFSQPRGNFPCKWTSNSRGHGRSTRLTRLLRMRDWDETGPDYVESLKLLCRPHNIGCGTENHRHHNIGHPHMHALTSSSWPSSSPGASPPGITTNLRKTKINLRKKCFPPSCSLAVAFGRQNTVFSPSLGTRGIPTGVVTPLSFMPSSPASIRCISTKRRRKFKVKKMHWRKAIKMARYLSAIPQYQTSGVIGQLKKRPIVKEHVGTPRLRIFKRER